MIPGQLFTCLSVVGPDCPQRNDKFGIKINGSFATIEAAKAHAAKMQEADATFDIFVVECGKWLLIPPGREEMDTHYVDDKLEEIMSKYNENQAMAAKLFEERKRDMMAKPIKNSDTPFIKPGDTNSKFYNRPDEAPISHPADIVERLKKERPNEEMEVLVAEANVIVAQEVVERQKERAAYRAAAIEREKAEREKAEKEEIKSD
jgi:hypothetical protein